MLPNIPVQKKEIAAPHARLALLCGLLECSDYPHAGVTPNPLEFPTDNVLTNARATLYDERLHDLKRNTESPKHETRQHRTEPCSPEAQSQQC